MGMKKLKNLNQAHTPDFLNLLLSRKLVCEMDLNNQSNKSYVFQFVYYGKDISKVLKFDCII